MKKLFLFGILLLVMLSLAVVGVRAVTVTAEKGTCVIGPNQGSNVERLGQGVETQAGSVCDATAEGGCGACLEQCAPFKKIKDLYGCPLCAGDDWCNPECGIGEDPDCIVCIEDDWCNPECVTTRDDPDCIKCIGNDEDPVCYYEDQANDVATGISVGCGTPPDGNIAQSFTPTASPLTAVELRLRVGGSFPYGGYDTTINIKSGTPQGTLLGTATTFVPGPQTSGTQLMVNFELSPIEITPGELYVIELISPGQVILTWMRAGDNTYDGGTAFGCYGNANPDNDFIFTTYTTT